VLFTSLEKKERSRGDVEQRSQIAWPSIRIEDEAGSNENDGIVVEKKVDIQLHKIRES
jgi:hypothetical protein